MLINKTVKLKVKELLICWEQFVSCASIYKLQSVNFGDIFIVKIILKQLCLISQPFHTISLCFLWMIKILVVIRPPYNLRQGNTIWNWSLNWILSEWWSRPYCYYCRFLTLSNFLFISNNWWLIKMIRRKLGRPSVLIQNLHLVRHNRCRNRKFQWLVLIILRLRWLKLRYCLSSVIIIDTKLTLNFLNLFVLIVSWLWTSSSATCSTSISNF